MLDAIARSLRPSRSWQDDLADLYKSLFRRGEVAAHNADQQAREIYANAARELERLSAEAGTGLAIANRRGRRYARDAYKQYGVYEEALRAQVKTHPLKALAVAAAGGIIIGLLTSRN
jgi:ElaB/YqjD/DUF883 family membrane-anchored ribosome-binding protein